MQVAVKLAQHIHSSVLYIDNGNSFDINRCVSIIDGMTNSQSSRKQAMLSQILRSTCFDGFELLDILHSTKEDLHQANVNLKYANLRNFMFTSSINILAMNNVFSDQ